MDFKSLKKNRKSAFEQLADNMEKTKGGNYGNDLPLWSITRDKAGNGQAIIRFLPTKDEDIPWVRLFSHAFQDKGGWYIENSLTTLERKDPLGEWNQYLWGLGEDKYKDLARKQKRRLHYYSNIYVVNDPANPDNNGKVFLYKYGKTIFSMLNDLMHPEFDDENPVNPFDLWEGSNLRLRIRNSDGYPSYDKSTFDTAGPVNQHEGGPMEDTQLEELYNSTHSLQQIIDDSKFKTYEELLTRLNKVLGFNSQAKIKGVQANLEDEQTEAEPIPESKPKPVKKAEVSEDEDEDPMSFFDSLG